MLHGVTLFRLVPAPDRGGIGEEPQHDRLPRPVVVDEPLAMPPADRQRLATGRIHGRHRAHGVPPFLAAWSRLSATATASRSLPLNTCARKAPRRNRATEIR